MIIWFQFWTKTKIFVCKDNAVKITLSEAPVLTGHQAWNSLWKIQVVNNVCNIESCYQPKVANSAVPTFNDKTLWNIPLPTVPRIPSERINSKRIEVYCAYTAYTQPTLEALAIYLHACAGFPVTKTWCQAIGKGN